MDTSSNIRTGRHCVFNLHVHLVFVTKYRKKIFTKHMIDFLENLFKDICNSFDATLIECNGENDHIHLLINYPPKIAISRLVNSLKGVSSRLLRKEFPQIQKYYWKNVLWSSSYFAGTCGGAPISIVKKYIEKQN